ncbi:hypothetical protein HQN89_30050 [Paenibacillus frigoriresistens]|uniref:hypothetical protein n=1 Tax=Paenibacillus alginolyticus TaxID=59839 RepID=UPI00156459CD|nr:hypothetical protein [Paenibacillus frigoriresistens]NRF95132.1 hypothetical protein [Paenibacillus frigoriresistens]
MTFKAGQVLITDSDFEKAIKEKVEVVVYQGTIRMRPVSTLAEYNEETCKLSDGTRLFRRTNVVRTLNEEEN